MPVTIRLSGSRLLDGQLKGQIPGDIAHPLVAGPLSLPPIEDEPVAFPEDLRRIRVLESHLYGV